MFFTQTLVPARIEPGPFDCVIKIRLTFRPSGQKVVGYISEIRIKVNKSSHFETDYKKLKFSLNGLQ